MAEHNKKEESKIGNLQQPLGSGFGPNSTCEEVIKGIDLSGKNVIVTGGYAGIGLETTKTLVKAGAHVIVPARDVSKAERNLDGVANISVEKMDLLDAPSIVAFAEKFIASNKPLHLLINNAGIMWVPLQRDARGYESQLVTNHLGHFQLTALLWPALKKANGARVVNVSSYGHQIAPFNFEDPNFLHHDYESLQGYGQSKTANNLFAFELDNRGKAFGIRAYSLHPGSVNGTELARVGPTSLFIQLGTHDADGNIFPSVAAKLKTLSAGASTTIWCATSPQLNNIGGVYCENCDIAVLDNGDIEHKFDEPLSLRGVKPYSIDPDNAKRLWELSEKLTGTLFPAN